MRELGELTPLLRVFRHSGHWKQVEDFAKDGWGKPERQEEVGEIKDRKSRSLEWRPLLICHQKADSNIRPKG